MSEPKVDASGVRGAEDTEQVFDAIANLLRVLGAHGFDTATVPAAAAAADLEAWARHVLVGAAPPGRGDAAKASAERDWKGLCRHVSEKRKSEVEYVVQSGSDLRAALWSFIQGMARAVPAERSAATRLQSQLGRLRASLDSTDTSEIRRLAMESIDAIDAEIRERVERDREDIEAVSEHVRKVTEELTVARDDLDRDDLTGLFSRASFDAYAERIAQLGQLSGLSHLLFLIDVDDFKWVNDRVGPSIADEVLREVSATLMQTFARRSDFVARYGGDEIGVLLRSEDLERDRLMGEEALHRVRDLSVPNGDDAIRVTLSMGGARLRPGESVEDWFARADRALHAAKDAGRDRLICAFDEENER